MAKDNSFDIVSEVDLQAIDDVVNVVTKEINTRFDLKGTGAEITFNRTDKKVTILATAEFQLRQIKDILKQKLAKRGLNLKCLKMLSTEAASNDMVKETSEVVCGIPMELAKEMVKDIKGLKLKVQSAIQENQVSISGKSRDELQQVIAFVRNKDYPIPLQFTNYRQ